MEQSENKTSANLGAFGWRSTGVPRHTRSSCDGVEGFSAAMSHLYNSAASGLVPQVRAHLLPLEQSENETGANLGESSHPAGRDENSNARSSD